VLGRLPVTDEGHRVTAFEVFFDLAFVFAFTRIIAFMAADVTPLVLLQGLILLVLMWWAWSAYTWLGNQTRADVGPALVAGIGAMAAIFVVGLLLPDAWNHDAGLPEPLVLAAAYVVVRVLYLTTYWYAAAPDPGLRRQLRGTAIPAVVSLVPILVGALTGGTIQIVLWAGAFVIDFLGGRILSSYGGYRVRSPGYFAERHRLVTIIALGESLFAVGPSAVNTHVTVTLLGAALLGFIVTLCLWLLYARQVAPVVERRLSELDGSARAWLARDVGTFLHLLLIAGIIYVALGLEQVLDRIAEGSSEGEALGWPVVIALYGGAGLYLIGLAAVRRRCDEAGGRGWLAAAILPWAALPAARTIPPLAALALVTAVLAGASVRSGLSPRRAEPR
jgi:low temperature requirement protein LtrA